MDGNDPGARRAGRSDGLRRVRPLKVLKFGGTSVGAVDRLRRVVEIVAAATREHHVVVVASAAAGVTDRLVAAFEKASGGAVDLDGVLEELRTRHERLAADLLPAERAAYGELLRQGLAELREALGGVHGDASPARRDRVVSAGERLSVPLVAAALRQAGVAAFPQDAAEIVRTDDTFGEAVVDLGETERLVRAWHAGLSSGTVPVVTGFIGSTATGETTTLGRGGSDYSAALLAHVLRASALERWTDVDGLYTDDPRRNEHARRLAYVVLEEAVAWNHAGRLGMHRKALDPLVEAGIPAYVRSTAAPDEPGTVILPAGHRLAQAAGFGS